MQRPELFTDLYELTMLQSYFHEGMNGTAVFDLFVRRLQFFIIGFLLFNNGLERFARRCQFRPQFGDFAPVAS